MGYAAWRSRAGRRRERRRKTRREEEKEEGGRRGGGSRREKEGEGGGGRRMRRRRGTRVIWERRKAMRTIPTRSPRYLEIKFQNQNAILNAANK